MRARDSPNTDHFRKQRNDRASRLIRAVTCRLVCECLCYIHYKQRAGYYLISIISEQHATSVEVRQPAGSFSNPTHAGA